MNLLFHYQPCNINTQTNEIFVKYTCELLIVTAHSKEIEKRTNLPNAQTKQKHCVYSLPVISPLRATTDTIMFVTANYTHVRLNLTFHLSCLIILKYIT